MLQQRSSQVHRTVPFQEGTFAHQSRGLQRANSLPVFRCQLRRIQEILRATHGSGDRRDTLISFIRSFWFLILSLVCVPYPY
jgi:hypothetical protein